VVDPKDRHFLEELTWSPLRGQNTTYARARKKDGKDWVTVLLHRLIMNAPPGVEVDHENGNGLDNRRSNLRLATPAQNNGNQKPRGGSSVFKGVCWHKQRGKWYARISHRSLGLFAVEEDAARAYDKAALQEFGEFARCNFEKVAV
jgi:hypothetical protein